MAELTADAWLRLWLGCHVSGAFGMVRTAWPDGGCLLQQPAVTVEVFSMISNLAAQEAARE